MNTINKTLFASLALVSVFTLSGCTDDDKSPAETVAPTLTPEEQKVVNEYIKPTTNAQGEVIEAIDPLVQLLSN
ncbi:TPA: hypothetical protein EYG96_01580 [Candidatus Gracilibacteria bacterium]|nr:hypothetical protein [Candidatus Peregrinibacteria bacterium]HIQ56714.1 hypothetical protein [Candidatus Gracilibacteria bacterium]HIQ57789.1 hypothetical protein [Candidatus Gracilibacteria bacterium]